jgi:hypothetical protein
MASLLAWTVFLESFTSVAVAFEAYACMPCLCAAAQDELTALKPNLITTVAETERLMATVQKEKTEVGADLSQLLRASQ